MNRRSAMSALSLSMGTERERYGKGIIMKRAVIIISFMISAVFGLSGCFGTQVVVVQETTVATESQDASPEDRTNTSMTAAQGETVDVSYSNSSSNNGELSKSGSIMPTTTSQSAQPVQQGVYDRMLSLSRQSSYGKLSFVSGDVSEYPVVKLYFSYTDDSGEQVEFLSPKAAIMESIAGGGKIERTVKSIRKLQGNEGVSIDIVADKSGSMDADLKTMQNVMTEFVRSLDFANGDQAEIISFDSYVMYMCTYSGNPEMLSNGISNMTAYGQTALYDALITGINNAAAQRGARCVIGFTDGEDNSSTHTYNDVIQTANEKDVPVYIIGTGSAESSVLTEICTKTSGYYWKIDSINDLKGIMSRIYRNTKSMYCIEYESDPESDPYAKRLVDCVVSGENHNCYAGNITFTPVKEIRKTGHSERYEVIRDDVTWTQANEICMAKGGHLATITTQEEMDKLVAMTDAAGIKNAWIGGYTSVRDGKAFGHWVTGEAFDFAKWYPGEPSRNDKDGTPEFYLVLWNVKGEWSFNDERDDMVSQKYLKGKCGYICEYEN